MYIHTTDIHNTNAANQIIPYLLDKIEIKSVLDIGTGLGTWLAVFLEHGINDVLGMDGDHVDKKLLAIPESKFRIHDLRERFDLKRAYDLVLSLEVIEHIEPEFEDIFFDNIIKHSETVLFSAAIPGQGGQNHFNEKWQSYWIQKFEKAGYTYFDPIRPLFWNNYQVDWWYRQNILLFSRRELHFPNSDNTIKDIVIKDLYEKQMNEINILRNNLFEKERMYYNLLNGQTGIKQPFIALLKAIKNKFS